MDAARGVDLQLNPDDVATKWVVILMRMRGPLARPAMIGHLEMIQDAVLVKLVAGRHWRILPGIPWPGRSGLNSWAADRAVY